eukprot:gene9385-biopygen13174
MSECQQSIQLIQAIQAIQLFQLVQLVQLVQLMQQFQFNYVNCFGRLDRFNWFKHSQRRPVASSRARVADVQRHADLREHPCAQGVRRGAPRGPRPPPLWFEPAADKGGMDLAASSV